jgi:hypothetical protein
MELKSNGDSRSALLWRIIQRLRIPRSRSWLFALVVMTIGGLLRFTHLETSVYWGDEVYSSLRIFGHTTQQLHAAIAAGQLVSHDQLQVFQQLIPTQGLDRTLASLAVEDAHIAPLYFVLARIWGSIFGDSAAAMRSLAALFSLLLIPASYYLAMDLFNLPRSNGQPQLPRRTTNAIASWMMILVASSPLHFLMAREARGYSLWTLTTVLSSIFLLRALKQSQLQQSQLQQSQQSQQSQLQQSQWDRWVLFSITMALNFYSNFLAFITLTGYLVYVIVLYWRDRTILRQFGVAVSLSLLSFFPWLSLFITRAVVENHDGEGVIGTFDGRLALRNWASHSHGCRQRVNHSRLPSDLPNPWISRRLISGLTDSAVAAVFLRSQLARSIARSLSAAQLHRLAVDRRLRPRSTALPQPEGCEPERCVNPAQTGNRPDHHGSDRERWAALLSARGGRRQLVEQVFQQLQSPGGGDH